MPIRQITFYDYISLSHIENDVMDASISIELPFDDVDKLDYNNCIVLYFDYDYSNPLSNRTYKRIKFYVEVSKEILKKDMIGLGKLQGIYIFLDQEEETANKIIEKIKERHRITT